MIRLPAAVLVVCGALPASAVGELPPLSPLFVVMVRFAAESGDAGAQFNLGWMYDNGEGVPEDDAEAVRWYRKAAEQGNTNAQFNLGWMYLRGYGVPADFVFAYAWFNVAAAQGNEDMAEIAKFQMAELAKLMTREQIAEAQRKSHELAAQIAQ